MNSQHTPTNSKDYVVLEKSVWSFKDFWRKKIYDKCSVYTFKAKDSPPHNTNCELKKSRKYTHQTKSKFKIIYHCLHLLF